jgi:hypothetical protein
MKADPGVTAAAPVPANDVSGASFDGMDSWFTQVSYKGAFEPGKANWLAGWTLTYPEAAPALARVQVIHNSADAAADTVDVWLNDALLLDNFAFRTASPFIDAPAGVSFDITIQPSTSTDTTNGLWRKSYTLEDGKTYVLVANGIVSASGYDPVKAFDIYVNAMGREEAATAGNVDVLVFHGSTDAPTVDIHEATAGELIDNLSYGEYADDYLELPEADYTIQVRDEAGTNVVASFEAPLETLNLADSALVVVASGFLTPANNSNGPAFGLWVALPVGGNLIELPATSTSTNNILSKEIGLEIYPNPVSADMKVSFTLDEPSEIRMDILSITGQMVMSRDLGLRGSGDHMETMDVSSFSEGIYLLRFWSGKDIHTSKIKVMR